MPHARPLQLRGRMCSFQDGPEAEGDSQHHPLARTAYCVNRVAHLLSIRESQKLTFG